MQVEIIMLLMPFGGARLRSFPLSAALPEGRNALAREAT